jgi:hypothetical protein
VRFGDALDPVLKLAASLWQLHSYHVAGTGRSPIRETCGERDSLTGSKLVFRHSATFPTHACDPARQEGFVFTADRIFQSGKAVLKRRETTDAVMVSVLAAVSTKTRMPDPPFLARGRMLGDVSDKLQSRVSNPA